MQCPLKSGAPIARERVARDHGKNKSFFTKGEGERAFLGCFHFLPAISTQVEKLFP